MSATATKAPSFLARRRHRRGGALLELLLTAAISVLSSVVLLQQMAEDTTGRRLAAAAQQVSTIRNAAEHWLTVNASAISAQMTALGCAGACRADVPLMGNFTNGAAGDPVGIQAAGHLPSGWIATTAQGRPVKAVVARHADGRLEGYVALDLGDTLTIGQVWRVATAVGAMGGARDSRIATNSLSGLRGGWSISLTAAPFDTGTTCVTASLASPRSCYVPALNDVVAAFYSGGS